MPPTTYERLQDDGWRLYRVDPDRNDEFLELQRRVEAIFREHALGWALWRCKEPAGEWEEYGPEFREDADRRAAAASFDEQPDLLDAIAGFEIDPGNRITVRVGKVTEPGQAQVMVDQQTGAEWELVFEVGKQPSPGETRLPPIPAEEMSEAMQLGYAVAKAIASRLSKVVPDPFTTRAEGEVLSLRDANGYGRDFSLVDLEPVEAVEEVLWGIQDDITEELTVPWPHDPAQGYAEHDAHAEIRQGAIYGWYGPKEAPVLELEPIPLEELNA